MGKAAKLKQARKLVGPERHLPAPAVPVPPGRITDRDKMTVALPRAANFWRELGGRTVQCDLCYKACVLKGGETGWCGYRRNVAGALDLPDHGVLARHQSLMLGYQGGLHTFLPGAPALGIGGIRCTARCAYCTSANIVWDPAKIPWQGDQPRALGTNGQWHYELKAILHPAAVVQHAQERGARAIVFSENEPLLSWEYTYDVARLAQAADIRVVVYTNGFSEPAAIAALAPFVNVVDVGIKGSLDPTFYATKMRSPGATEAVKASLLAWRAAGVYLLISDLIATQYQQDDATQEAASARLYAWIAAELGPHIPVMLGHMHQPDGRPGEAGGYLLPKREAALVRYRARIAASHARARDAGLAYAHESNSDDRITCHACGGLLLERHAPACGLRCPNEVPGRPDVCWQFLTGCTCWDHTQHVTDSRCDHCGAAVPLVTLPRAELDAFRAGTAAKQAAHPLTWRTAVAD